MISYITRHDRYNSMTSSQGPNKGQDSPPDAGLVASSTLAFVGKLHIPASVQAYCTISRVLMHTYMAKLVPTYHNAVQTTRWVQQRNLQVWSHRGLWGWIQNPWHAMTSSRAHTRWSHPAQHKYPQNTAAHSVPQEIAREKHIKTIHQINNISN